MKVVASCGCQLASRQVFLPSNEVLPRCLALVQGDGGALPGTRGDVMVARERCQH